jgi:hypothetical protein
MLKAIVPDVLPRRYFVGLGGAIPPEPIRIAK